MDCRSLVHSGTVCGYIQSLPTFSEGILRANVTLNEELSLFTRGGGKVFQWILGILAVMAFVWNRKGAE